jgi:hypothetical protein
VLALQVIELLENFHSPSLKQKVPKCSFWRKRKRNSVLIFCQITITSQIQKKPYCLIWKRKSLPFLQVGWYQRIYTLASTQLWEHLLANQSPDVWMGYWQDTHQSWTDVPWPIANLWPGKETQKRQFITTVTWTHWQTLYQCPQLTIPSIFEVNCPPHCCFNFDSILLSCSSLALRSKRSRRASFFLEKDKKRI